MDSNLKLIMISFIVLGSVLAYGVSTFSQIMSSTDCLNAKGIIQDGELNPLVINPLRESETASNFCLGQKTDSSWMILVFPIPIALAMWRLVK